MKLPYRVAAFIAAGSLVACAPDATSPTDSAVPSDAVIADAANAPKRVTDLAVASKTDTSITISFTQVSNGAGGASSYDIRIATGNIVWWQASAVSQGTCKPPVAGTTVGTKLTCTITGLAASTTYGVQLVAFRGTLNVNAVFGQLSNKISSTTAATPPPPPPPPPVTNPGTVTNLSVSAVTDTSLTISFTEVTNGAGAPASYDIRSAAAPGFAWWTATTVARGTCTSPLAGTGIGTTRTCTILGLAPSTAYSVQLVAFRGTLNVDAVFGSLSNVATDTTAAAAAPPPPPPPANLFWEEMFEDTNFGSRAWYDNTSPQTSGDEHTAASTRSLMFRWAPGATTPTNGSAMRRKFTASNSAYVSYDVKYSANYVGSAHSYHPHEFHVLSSMDGDWDGLSNNWMTLYIEQNWAAGSGGRPRLAMQDNKAINTTLGALPLNLIGITENRSTGGCNGMSEVGMVSECFVFAPWYNSKQITGPVSFQAGQWHHVEVYFQLNTVSNGIGQPNGIMQYWVDGALKIDRQDILFRTGARASLQLNQFVIAPYIGDGSPVDQTMWIDNLRLAAAR